MPLWGNKWRFGIFKRLLISFLIALIPIYALGFYMYNWSKTEIKQEITESAQAQANYYINDIQSRLNRISAMQYEMLGDPFVIELANASETLEGYDKIQSILYIRARLESIKSSSEWIEDVRLLAPNTKISISATEGLESLEPGLLNVDRLSSPHKLVDDDQKLFMEAASPLLAFGTTADYMPDFIVEIELSIEALKSDMDSSNERPYTGNLSLTLGNGFKIQSIINAPQRKGDYITIQAKSEEFDVLYSQAILKDRIYETVNRHVFWFWIFSILTLVAALLFLLYTNRTIRIPLAKIVRAFRNVEDGNLNLSIHHHRHDEFNYIYDRFNNTLASVRQLIDQVYKQKILLQDAELKQLQSQINPHFLYNSLFMVVRLIKAEKLEQATEFVNQLASYFRFVTRNTSDTVRLADEVEHSLNYANIQQIRFHDRIWIQFDEPPEHCRDLIVPRLILQPLIENAFVHALEDKLEGGLLKVSFAPMDKGWQIKVEDNGDNPDAKIAELQALLGQEQHHAEVTAVLNVDRRLKYKFGPGSGLEIGKAELGGVKVIMKLLETEDNDGAFVDRG
ncbi:two-component system, sensor histidine kinase YesM [Paenibacillaceae bacterium GAS479]|nr:two-component system, sensor histidine kinase YesM [Paenibacillaceae bacterium GAS479]